ncbi:DUF6096 family protein [Ligilactobacillus sp. WILCCON 0076]|uniref:DUF6096 family protein n=1 Tax=Ligilactobacillus ubinensis TaxID=2876789 RepID=A0A9X2FJL2_9LACO|nr:DUF6096 family protein [Ligilactobacillus ubinensis]MCP0886927.1 DUF6096 family protein [Ligilactobacillus ubinensis]
MATKKAMKEFQLGDLTLELKLTTQDMVAIEARLGNRSLMSLFMDGDGAKMPSIKDCLIFLQGANQVHGVTDEKIAQAFEKFLQAGNSPIDLITVISEVLQESGFFGKKVTQSKTNSVLQLEK